jgi:hypothetical protein
MASLDLKPILGYVTSMLGGYVYSGAQRIEWFRFSQADELAKKCWDAIDTDQENAWSGSVEPMMVANNHPAGHLAQYWRDRVSHLWRGAPDDWEGIPPELADYLAELLSPNDGRSQVIEVALCAHLHFFYEADKDWCKQFLLPRLGWSDEVPSTQSLAGISVALRL